MSSMTAKPFLFYMTTTLAGIIVAGGIVSIAHAVLRLSKTKAASDDGFVALGMVFISPLIILFLLQLTAGLVLLVVLLRRLKEWNQGAILLSVAISPFLLLFAEATVVREVTRTQDTALPGAPIAPIVPASVYMFISGVVAYNDIRYRKPRFALNGVKK